MITQLLNICLQLVESLGYLGIFLAMALESVFAPIPSEAVMGFGGYLVYQGKFDFFTLVAIGAAGNLLGSYIIYYIGKFGGVRFIRRFGKYLAISEDDLKRAEGWFERYGTFAIFVAQVIPLVRSLISFPAGVLNVNLFKFSAYTFAGAFIWSTFLVYLGTVLGVSWVQITALIKPIENVVMVVLLVLLILYVGWRLGFVSRVKALVRKA